MNVQRIVTHPGGAHKDDLLAVCVLIARHGVPVYRRLPTESELLDPATAIVDIGGRHEPERLNFDHHHFDREHPPTCALSLVLAHMDLYRDALSLCDWLEPAEWFDSRGPKKTAEWLQVPRKAISQLNSPIDITALRRFAGAEQLHPGETLYEFLRFIGADLLDYLETAKQRIAETAKRVEVWPLPPGAGSTSTGALAEGTEMSAKENTPGRATSPEQVALFLPRSEPLPDEPSASLGAYVRSAGLAGRTAVLIYPDRRGSGYGVCRYEDHPSFDFSRVEGQPDVHFAHKSGFLCKTSAQEPARLKELIALARVA